MTFDSFASLILFTFFISYFVLLTFANIIKLFPGGKSHGLRVDFRKNE